MKKKLLTLSALLMLLGATSCGNDEKNELKGLDDDKTEVPGGDDVVVDKTTGVVLYAEGWATILQQNEKGDTLYYAKGHQHAYEDWCDAVIYEFPNQYDGSVLNDFDYISLDVFSHKDAFKALPGSYPIKIDRVNYDEEEKGEDLTLRIGSSGYGTNVFGIAVKGENKVAKVEYLGKSADGNFLYAVTGDYVALCSGTFGDELKVSGSYRIITEVKAYEDEVVVKKEGDESGDILEIVKGTESIAITQGMAFTAMHGDRVYKIKVVKAEAGDVILNIKGREVELSDAGTSFCSIDMKGLYNKEAEADPSSILFALAPNSKTIISGTESANNIISSGADKTFFLANY